LLLALTLHSKAKVNQITNLGNIGTVMCKRIIVALVAISFFVVSQARATCEEYYSKLHKSSRRAQVTGKWLTGVGGTAIVAGLGLQVVPAVGQIVGTSVSGVGAIATLTGLVLIQNGKPVYDETISRFFVELKSPQHGPVFEMIYQDALTVVSNGNSTTPLTREEFISIVQRANLNGKLCEAVTQYSDGYRFGLWGSGQKLEPVKTMLEFQFLVQMAVYHWKEDRQIRPAHPAPVQREIPVFTIILQKTY
jgi:hypothetical protein